MSKEQLELVKKNNELINKKIEEIISSRRKQRIPFEKDGNVDSKIKKILEFEIYKCLATYNIEFSKFTSQGRDTVDFKVPNETADCYGGPFGLQVTYGMQDFVDRMILPRMKEMGYSIKENGEPYFDTDIKKNTEHELIENRDNISFEGYVGSNRDQMDYFALLLAKNGIDLDFVWDALAHEEMHTFGVSNGNDFLKEGITEELTREVCEKYSIHMSPHAHTQEANVVRKLEMVVGRENVIEAGMWTGKFKEEQFGEILENNSNLNYYELSEMFELLKVKEASKLTEKEKERINTFSENNPEIAKKLKEKINLYYEKEEKNERYEKLAKQFDKNLNLKQGSFYKYLEIFDNLYSLTSNYKKDPRLYRDVYNFSLDYLKNGYKLFDGKELTEEDIEIITNIENLYGDLSQLNGIEINSFADLMEPINNYIEKQEPQIDINYDETDLSEILKIQADEMRELGIKEQELNMQSVVRNAITKGIATEDINKANNVERDERKSTQEKIELFEND